MNLDRLSQKNFFGGSQYCCYQIKINYVYQYQTIFLPSVSIDIEISGMRCFLGADLPNSLLRFSSVPKRKQILQFCFRGK